MTRARIAAAALHSYPREFRAAHGPEMLSTALDASEGSRRRFARELADLVRLGLRRRAAQTARLGARRLVADAACLTASWFMVIDLGSQIAKKMSGDPDRALPTWVVALIAVTLVLTLIGYDRIAGVAALSYTAIGLHELLRTTTRTSSCVDARPIRLFRSAGARSAHAAHRRPPARLARRAGCARGDRA